VDEALLTGESRPVARGPGDKVIAGTINLLQPVKLRVSASGDETTISSLGRLLLLAQSRRPGSSGLPSWLVPAFIVAVLVIATGTWFTWQWLDPVKAFPAMLAVLVASCPCALSLALPVVYAAASHRLLDEGILLTRGDALHALAGVDTAVFDKTGTLTHGAPRIVGIDINPSRVDFNAAQALRIARALESASAHPIARAFRRDPEVVEPAGPGGIAEARDVVVHAAKGLEGKVDGQHWRVGSAAYAGPDGDDDEAVWLADRDGWVARFELQDRLRRDAVETIGQLRGEGLDTMVLSGDSEQAVERVARRLEIPRWHARQSPESKLERLEALRGKGRRVLMVGDGVNDAPVLAAADVSMTVKGGAELANSAADLILTSDSLSLVNRARRTAASARQLVAQNLTWAVLYNASVMPLAVSGMLKPWMAALGMSLSSLLVVANASRIVRGRARVPVKQQTQALGADPV
jgi:Cu2+-exporting ATPase